MANDENNKNTLEEQKLAELDKQLEELGLKKKAAEEAKQKFLGEISTLKEQLSSLLKEEQLIEEKVLEIEEMERKAPSGKKSRSKNKGGRLTTKGGN